MRLPPRLLNALRYVLAFAMIGVGIDHFVHPGPFVGIVPAALPSPLTLVLVSGFFEILGGIGLLIPRVRRAAAWGLIALYIAVFPANVNMAINHLPLGGDPVPSFVLWLRLPLQLVLIAWAFAYTRRDRSQPNGALGSGRHDAGV